MKKIFKMAKIQDSPYVMTKLIPKFIWQGKAARREKMILGKNIVGSMIPPHVKSSYWPWTQHWIVLTTKTAGSNRHAIPGAGEPERTHRMPHVPHSGRNTSMEGKIPPNGPRATKRTQAKEQRKPCPYPAPSTKTNPKWICEWKLKRGKKSIDVWFHFDNFLKLMAVEMKNGGGS